jgi:hypothetical protein
VPPPGPVDAVVLVALAVLADVAVVVVWEADVDTWDAVRALPVEIPVVEEPHPAARSATETPTTSRVAGDVPRLIIFDGSSPPPFGLLARVALMQLSAHPLGTTGTRAGPAAGRPPLEILISRC